MWLTGKSIRQMHSGLFKSGNKRGAGGIGGVFIMFSKEKKQLKNLPKQIMKDMSKHISKKLTDPTAPVRTGHYIMSHVVGLNEPVYPRSAVKAKPPFPPRADPGQEAAMKNTERAKLIRNSKALSKSPIIHFGNSASYAHLVEFIGWTPIGGIKGPYHVFGKAGQSLELRKKQIVSEAKQKVFK